MTNITEVRGDTIPWRIAVTRDGSVLNIAGATFKFTAKRWKTDVIALIEKDNDAFTIEDAANGIVIMTLDPEDTSIFTDTTILNYDIEMTESGGRKSTIARGMLTLELDISE